MSVSNDGGANASSEETVDNRATFDSVCTARCEEFVDPDYEFPKALSRFEGWLITIVSIAFLVIMYTGFYW